VGEGGRQLAKLKGLVDDDGLENLMYKVDERDRSI